MSARPRSAPTTNFCGKASWFFSGAGTHDLVFGVDTFSDIRKADNWQSASGYLLGTWTDAGLLHAGQPVAGHATRTATSSGVRSPKPRRATPSRPTRPYVNDTWRINDKLTVNLGLRYDQNDGTDQGGVKTVDDSRISPRLSASYDVKGDGKIIIIGGAVALRRSVWPTRSVTQARRPATRSTTSISTTVPTIMAGTPEYPTNGDAIDAVFDHFFNVYGGVSNTDTCWSTPTCRVCRRRSGRA